MGKIFRRLFFAGPEEPFVMELPPYRLPTLKGTAIHMWERGSMFLRKAGTVILAGSVLMWFMGAFPWGVEYAGAASYAGRLGRVLEPVVRPLGFDWKLAVALLFGVVAKEIVVSTMGVLYGLGGDVGEHSADLQQALQGAMTPLTAYGFMVFTLIYVPCLPTVAVIKQETGSWKWTALAVGYTVALAWIMAFIVIQGGRLLGLG
jgi:ferrous iron transport protein B